MKKVITVIVNVLCKSVHQKREIEITEVTVDDNQHNKFATGPLVVSTIKGQIVVKKSLQKNYFTDLE